MLGVPDSNLGMGSGGDSSANRAYGRGLSRNKIQGNRISG
jgi:hypothetical protein